MNEGVDEFPPLQEAGRGGDGGRGCSPIHSCCSLPDLRDWSTIRVEGESLRGQLALHGTLRGDFNVALYSVHHHHKYELVVFRMTSFLRDPSGCLYLSIGL